MSTGSPLSVTRRRGAYELVGVPRTAGHEQSTSRRGLLAIGGLLASGAVVTTAAAHTAPLLPESIRLGPLSLGGPFSGLGIDIHSGGAIAALAFMFACYWVVVRAARQLSPRVVLTAIAALVMLVLLAPPLVSTDIFSYQAYARMGGLYGISPYTHGPYAISFDNVIFPYVGAKWSTIPSAYGPVFTALSYITATMSVVGSVFAYKTLAALSAIALVALVWQCARLRGTNQVQAAALVGLNPLLIVYGVGGGHNDLLMLVALVGGLYAVLLSKERMAGGLTIIAAGIKLTAGVVLPFALAAGGPRARRNRRDLLLGAGVTVAVVAALSLAVFGIGSIDMLKTINQSQSEGDWQTLPGFLSTALHLWTVARIVGYVLAAVFVGVTCRLLLRVWRGELDWVDGAAWATFTMLVASSSLLPWYVGWLLPLAGLAHDRRLVKTSLVFTGIVLLFQLVGYIPHASGLV